MRCGHCGRNQATKTYEQIKNNKKVVEYYCMDCYERLFLSVEEGAETVLSVCPYCGTTLEEFRASKLVGCARCYPALKEGIMPMILKMQGERAHTGKTPPLDFFETDDYLHAEFADVDFRARAMEKARFERQCNELETIIAKLKAEDNYEDAKGYADKLSLMRSNQAIEEEFVWRTQRNSSKRS